MTDDRATPEVDALHAALVRASEDTRTWIEGKDYCDMRELAEKLERERDETKELLENCAHVARGGMYSDWWSVAIEQRRKRIRAERELSSLQKTAQALLDRIKMKSVSWNSPEAVALHDQLTKKEHCNVGT